MIQTGKFTISPIIKGLRYLFSQVFCTLLRQEVFALAGGRTMTKCHNGESCVYGLDMLDIQAMLEEYA